MASIEDLYSSIANAASSAGAHGSLAVHAGQLASAVPAIGPDMTNAGLQEFFRDHPDMETVAIVEDDVPVGLVNRNAFMEQYSKPFSRELFGKKSCLGFADAAPLIAAEDAPIEVLVRHAVEPDARVMKDGFICTRGGKYFGLGTGMSLLKAMSDIEAEKTRQLLSSIDYASAIQQSNLRSSNQELLAAMPAAQLTWLPRDVVGGDCYFFRTTKNGIFGAIIDCTGHGVPGAFMTLIALSYLENQVASGAEEPDPGVVLSGLNTYIKKVLGQRNEEKKPGSQAADKSDDGMDAFMFVLTEAASALHYAGARLELALVQPQAEEVSLFEGDRMGVGYSDTPDDFIFRSHRVRLPAGYRALVTTDGVIDQIGGPKSIAHGRRRLYQMLSEERALAPKEFSALLLERFAEWQGQQRRRDDVCFLAFAAEGQA
ncbi:SpoIIE family protein phosphatase [Noviherbaspirillum sedimenti]|uniref:SpoIIE family protein phosphatase n=1 Tax=Noviherbaspirillum sedimenti TaxID=2320865 RepID=UPI0013148CD8|nr:SpoIIE family protein phosphatase [Noviherbaspirillum sedimenti]